MTDYTPKTWVNGGTPALSAANIQTMDDGIDTAHSELQDHLDDTADAHTGTAITNTPAGDIVAITVQAAINELDTEKAPLASPTFTGTLTVPVALTGVLRADTGVVSVDGDVTDLVDNLPYTALADATDGSLITWDADGAPALVATGDAGQILTSNGTGAAPTFQAGRFAPVDASGDTTTYVILAGDATGAQSALTDAGITYNADTNALTTTTFIGALNGNADTVTVADAADDTTTYVLLGTDATGSLSPRTDAGITYNASTNALTATTFVGALTGAASSNLLLAGGTMTGSLALPVTSKTTTYTLTSADYLCLCDATGGVFTVTLPTAVGATGRLYVIKKTDSTGNAVTIDGDGSETIDGIASASLNLQYEAISVISDNANWYII